ISQIDRAKQLAQAALGGFARYLGRTARFDSDTNAGVRFEIKRFIQDQGFAIECRFKCPGHISLQRTLVKHILREDVLLLPETLMLREGAISPRNPKPRTRNKVFWRLAIRHSRFGVPLYLDGSPASPRHEAV